MPAPDPYTVLGVPRTASDAEIALAYRRLVRELHPDTQPDPDPRRLGEVITACRRLRHSITAARNATDTPPPGGGSRTGAVSINVHVRRPRAPRTYETVIRAGPVHWHRAQHPPL